MKMKLSLLAASAILAIGMAGCGTESSSTSTAPAIVAKALDGYLSGATGCVDTNNNDVCDAGEYTFTTGTDGGYTIPAVNNTGKVIITGGTDLDTNATFTGVLKAPKGSKMATPLTTLLADGMTQAQITTMLGLPAGTDLSADFRGTNFNATLAEAAATVQAVIGQLTAVFSTDATLTKAAIMTSIVTNMATTLTSPADLKDTAKLTTLITAVDTSLASSVSSASAATVAAALVTTVTAIEALTFTEDLAKTTTTTISTAATAATAAVALEKSVTIANNTFTIGGPSSDNNATFDQNGSFGSVSVSSTGNANIRFTLENNGGELSAAKTIDIAIMIDAATSSSELKAVLKGATVTDTGIIVPAGAILYVNGTDSNGNLVSVELTDMVEDVFTSTAGVTSVNLTNIMNRIEAKVPSPSAFASITKEGTYNISFYIGGNVTLGFDGTTVKALTAPKESLTVKLPSGDQTVTGTKFTGTLVVH